MLCAFVSVLCMEATRLNHYHVLYYGVLLHNFLCMEAMRLNHYHVVCYGVLLHNYLPN